jgi:hypothetical protein
MNTTRNSSTTITQLSPGEFLKKISEGNHITTNNGADGLIKSIENDTFAIKLTVQVPGVTDDPSCDLHKENNCFLEVRTTRAAALLCIDQDCDVTTIEPENKF